MNGSVRQQIMQLESQVAATYEANETLRDGVRKCYNELIQFEPDLEIARMHLWNCYPGGQDALRLAVHGRSRKMSDHRTRDEKMQDFVDETLRRLSQAEERIRHIENELNYCVRLEQLNSAIRQHNESMT